MGAPVPITIERTYIVAVFQTCVIVGRVSAMNLSRAEVTVKNLPGPNGEQLQEWQTGTRDDLLETYPDLLGDWSFEKADAAYAVNPTQQIQFDRPDLGY